LNRLKKTGLIFQLGAEKMYLDLNAENVGAFSLYQSLSYQVEGRLKKEIKIGDRYIDLILMGKQLK
jgi:ribosomal protein S18 acetylase RimI-like enzyme